MSVEGGMECGGRDGVWREGWSVEGGSGGKKRGSGWVEGGNGERQGGGKLVRREQQYFMNSHVT